MILPEHKKLLGLIAKAEATQDRADGFFDGWVHLPHGALARAMKMKSGWPPLVNLAKGLIEQGLLEARPEDERHVRLTPAGKQHLQDASVKVRAQAHPPLDISNLHPSVAKAAGHLVADGHYRQAVLDTFIALIGEVRSRAQVSASLDGVPLMQHVFSERAPVLAFGEKDAQLGHMWLYSGAVMAFRNVLSHSNATISDPAKALEILAFASYLFRALDEVARIHTNG